MGGLFANRWLVVAASVFGLLVGSGPVLIFSSGVFLKPVSAELGITRGDLSSAVFLAAICTAVACPVLGWLLDRFGTRLEKRFTRPEIAAMLESAGLSNIRFRNAEPFWCAVGIRR